MRDHIESRITLSLIVQEIPRYSTEILALIIFILAALLFQWRFNKASKARSTTLTIRISHIPEAIHSDELIEILEALANRQTQGTGNVGRRVLLWSFAPSATSADRGRERVATITLSDIPPVLGVGGQIDLKGADLTFPVTVDSDFFGLTPLSNPKGEITADIVAVTGLAGHAFGSWKSRNAPTMWLRDFLPEHVPTARILAYGYDSGLLGSESKASIHDFSIRFLQALKTARAHEEEKYRPIIFIGHSLGGLIIKQALARASKGSDQDKQIFSSCYGILFFGVPNRGLNISALRSMVKGQPNSRLVKDLDPSSHSLRILHEMFSDQFKFEDSPIVSVFETKLTKTVVETKKGVWKRVGPTVLMVPESSATYAGPTEKAYDQFSIDADHSDIVKFSSRTSPDYLIVRQKLIDFIKEAPVVIGKRNTIFGGDLLQPRANLPDYTQLQSRIKELLDPVDFEIDTTYRSWNRCRGTGDWLLSDPDFECWKDMLMSDIIWLHGSPGCGKTYLMSRALEYIKEQYSEAKVIITHFFCDNKTRNTEKQTMSSIVKTLLSQLLTEVLQSHPAEVEACLPQLERFAAESEIIPWLFQDTIRRIGKYLPKVFLVLDALDECEDVHSLLVLLKDLDSIQTTTFHIILASRESVRTPLFRINEGRVRGIRISQERVKHDVATFIRNKVRLLDIRDLGSEDEAAERLIDGSDSLFLLAHLRVESLKRKRIHTQQDLDEALLTLPEDLKGFYDKTLEGIKDLPDEKLALIRRIFLWVTYAKRRLNFKELVEAVSVPSDSPYSHQLTQRGLDDLCGGLLVFRFQQDPGRSGPLVELVHSTVKEYIFDFVWKTSSPSPSLGDQNECSSEITLAAINYMNRPEIQELDKHPLLDYLYKFWILHLLDINTPTIPLLENLPRFLESENCLTWWDSPLSATLNAKISDRRYLQSRFHGWVRNATHDPGFYQYADFIMTQQEKQVARRIQANGEMHLETLQSIFNLASMYSDERRYQEAQVLQVQVVDARRTILGEDHLDTLKAVSNLAATHGNQGRWNESEVLLLEVIAAFKRTLSEEHPDIPTAMGNLVTTYKGQGRLVEAEGLGVEIVDICKRVLGKEHPDTLAAMGSLAATYGELSKLGEAENLGLVVIDTCKNVLGGDHPDTLGAMRNLAATYANQRRWKEAEDLLVQLLASSKRILGEDHLETLAVMDNLVVAYHRQGEWRLEQEMDLKFQIVAINKKLFTEDHPNTLLAKISLTKFYDDLELEVLASLTKALGEEYSETFVEVANFFTSFHYMNSPAPWKSEWKEKVVKMNRTVFGEDHPNTLAAIVSLSNEYWNDDRLTEADDLKFQVMAASKRALGENHPITLAVMEILAIQFIRGRPAHLYPLKSQIMEIRRNNPRTLAGIARLATTYWKQGQSKQAEDLVDQILALACINIGENFFELMEAICLLAPPPESRKKIQWKQIESLKEAILSANPMPSECAIHEMNSLVFVYSNRDNLYR